MLNHTVITLPFSKLFVMLQRKSWAHGILEHKERTFIIDGMGESKLTWVCLLYLLKHQHEVDGPNTV